MLHPLLFKIKRFCLLKNKYWRLLLKWTPLNSNHVSLWVASALPAKLSRGLIYNHVGTGCYKIHPSGVLILMLLFFNGTSQSFFLFVVESKWNLDLRCEFGIAQCQTLYSNVVTDISQWWQLRPKESAHGLSKLRNEMVNWYQFIARNK